MDKTLGQIAFESWYAPRFAGNCVANMPICQVSGEYRSAQQQIAWEAWKASAAAVKEEDARICFATKANWNYCAAAIRASIKEGK